MMTAATRLETIAEVVELSAHPPVTAVFWSEGDQAQQSVIFAGDDAARRAFAYAAGNFIDVKTSREPPAGARRTYGSRAHAGFIAANRMTTGLSSLYTARPSNSITSPSIASPACCTRSMSSSAMMKRR